MRYLDFAWCFVVHLTTIVFLHFYIHVTNNTKIQTCRIDFASTDLVGSNHSDAIELPSVSFIFYLFVAGTLIVSYSKFATSA